jgi:hypothetical protein
METVVFPEDLCAAEISRRDICQNPHNMYMGSIVEKEKVPRSSRLALLEFHGTRLMRAWER